MTSAEQTSLALAKEISDAQQKRIWDLEDLVRWLSLPYGENRPLFALADWEGKPLDDGKRLEETYLSVVGERSEPPRVGVAWTRCPTCDTLQTVPVEP
jgi:hypothetical protein